MTIQTYFMRLKHLYEAEEIEDEDDVSIDYDELSDRDARVENMLLNYGNPNDCYVYALNAIKGRWPEGEEIIKKDPKKACYYASDVINGRWPEGEEIIKKDPEAAYRYAEEVVKGRWPEGERAILLDVYWSYMYSMTIIKGRWPEFEYAIINYFNDVNEYKLVAPYVFMYVRDVINGRWPEGEYTMMQDSEWYGKYLEFVVYRKKFEG